MENILVSKLRIYGLEDALVDSGNPHIASEHDFLYGKAEDNNRQKRTEILGNADNGTGHDKFLRGIVVKCNICISTAIVYS